MVPFDKIDRWSDEIFLCFSSVSFVSPDAPRHPPLLGPCSLAIMVMAVAAVVWGISQGKICQVFRTAARGWGPHVCEKRDVSRII